MMCPRPHYVFSGTDRAHILEEGGRPSPKMTNNIRGSAQSPNDNNIRTDGSPSLRNIQYLDRPSYFNPREIRSAISSATTSYRTSFFSFLQAAICFGSTVAGISSPFSLLTIIKSSRAINDLGESHINILGY
jgi:hypothetical protein